MMIPFPGSKMCVDIDIDGNESIALGKGVWTELLIVQYPQISVAIFTVTDQITLSMYIIEVLNEALIGL